jgi:hypothetical protein
LPFPPELNVKDDTSDKQDCEQKAIFRWFKKNYDKIAMIFRPFPLIFLADDLHSHEPLVSHINALGEKFIFNCKKSSHKSLYEFIEYNQLQSISYLQKVNGHKDEKLHVISWLSGIPLIDKAESSRVNWISLCIKDAQRVKEYLPNEEINNKKKPKKKYIYVIKDLNFNYITNIELTEENVKEITDIGRARWKIENNTFNTLKNGGYNIEHNFGHGKKYLSAVLITLNILALLFHNTLYLCDELWRQEFDRLNSRIVFFKKFNVALNFYLFSSFNELLLLLNNPRPPPSLTDNNVKNLITNLDSLSKAYEKEIKRLSTILEENGIKF